MRARAKRSLFTNWIDGEGPETGAGVDGGGESQHDGPEKK